MPQAHDGGAATDGRRLRLHRDMQEPAAELVASEVAQALAALEKQLRGSTVGVQMAPRGAFL